LGFGDGPANFVLHVRLKAAKLPIDQKTSNKTGQEGSLELTIPIMAGLKNERGL
jgi:hypothetical protein